MVLTDPGQARNKKQSHLSGMFIYLGPSAVKKPYFFYLKQHQNVLLRFHVISGYLKIYQKWPGRKHIYEGSEFRQIRT